MSLVNDVDSVKDFSNKDEEEIYDSSYEINNWDDLDNDPNILRGIYSYGFERPSPIQKKAIMPIIMGKDVIAQAQSGTGKTTAFGIGALSIVNVLDNFTQVLILSPTKELAKQTANVLEQIGSMMNGLRIQTIYGGSPYEEFNNFDHYIPCDFDQSYEENIKSISRQEESKESLVY
jgi:translation initiation factor 4A